MVLPEFLDKIRRRLLRMRLQPIRVFCFHQVSDEFEPDTMEKSDWMQTEDFKCNILALKKKYTFISLPEVKYHLEHDSVRTKRYASLTADDGWASLKNILPWLADQGIQVTLFLNPGYMDGKHFRARDTEKYLIVGDIEYYSSLYNGLYVASHGWQHDNVTSLSTSEFRESIENTLKTLKKFPFFVPFHAYTWGKHTAVSDGILLEFNLVPVLIDGGKNYNDPFCIHRELLK